MSRLASIWRAAAPQLLSALRHVKADAVYQLAWGSGIRWKDAVLLRVAACAASVMLLAMEKGICARRRRRFELHDGLSFAAADSR